MNFYEEPNIVSTVPGTRCGSVSSRRRRRRPAPARDVAVVDTWPDSMPVSAAELRAIEDHLGDILGRLFGSPKSRGSANDPAPARCEIR